MIYFNCDYNEGAHPSILKKLAETNFEQTIGYGGRRILYRGSGDSPETLR